MTDLKTNVDFVVKKGKLDEHRFVSNDLAALEEGEVRFRIDRYAFTANNVTYGVAGDMLNYWQFFPADEGWGRIPVWSIGSVIDSRHDDFNEGDRYYGYFPMSSTLTVQPSKVSPRGFVDNAAHRRELPPTYNQYSKMTPELGFEPAFDNHVMLYRPLFATSFLIDDWLGGEDYFGAKTLVVSSASSKTSFGLGYRAALRDGQRKIIGLTSPRNVAFVEGLGCFDTVVAYDDITSIPNNDSVAYVDMAGNVEVNANVHNHFADQLTVSSRVGITHWQDGGQDSNLPGPEPQMFFAPNQIQKRVGELGAQGFQQQIGAALTDLYTFADQHVDITEQVGQEAVETVYKEMLSGNAKPNEGFIVSIHA